MAGATREPARAQPQSLAFSLVGKGLWVPAIVFPKEQVPSGGGWPAVVTAVDAKHADCVDCKFMVEGGGGTPYFFPATEVQKWVVGSAVDAKELGREHGHAIAKSPGRRKSGAAATPKRPAATPKRPAVEKEDAAWAPRTGGKRRASVAAAATPTPAAAAEPASPAAQPSGSGKKRAAAAAAEEEALPASAGAQKKRRSPAAAPSVRGASPKRRRYAPPQPDTLGRLAAQGKEVVMMAVGSALTYGLLRALYPE